MTARTTPAASAHGLREIEQIHTRSRDGDVGLHGLS